MQLQLRPSATTWLDVFPCSLPQNTDIISLHNTAHSNYSSCTSILTNSPAAKLKGDMALHFVDEATAVAVLDTSALEGVDATLIAAMWAAESSFSLNPSNHYRVGDGGEDIGPMQLANTVWNKSPYIDNLGDVFGTNQSRGGTLMVTHTRIFGRERVQ